jgi:CPA2 family monovalent cation:H+ antiporter-2
VDAEKAPSRLGRHAVVVGYNEVGRTVAAVLAARFETIIVDEDQRLSREARDAGYFVVTGNPASPLVIERMHLEDTRTLIVALNDPFTTRLLAERARELNPHIDVAAVAISELEAERLRRSGISRTVVAEREAAFELARYGLGRFGVSAREALAIVQRLREGPR